MAPRLLSIRCRPVASSSATSLKSRIPCPVHFRYSSNNGQPPTEPKKPGPGPNQDQLPHVSEEAAATAEVMGETGPELEQGTPIKDVLKRDQAAKEKAPEVLKGNDKASFPKGSRPFSTFTARRSNTLQAVVVSEGVGEQPVEGHKFGLPALPLGPHDHLRYRYDPVIKQMTQLMMRDGKLARAQTNMARVLNHLRTANPPMTNPSRPLIPGTPPPSHLPLNPTLYLTVALDSIAPLMKLRSQSGIAGGGAKVQLPTPLRVHQRRRQAVMWILDAAGKKPSKGSGKGMFAQKVAEELIAIVEGKSPIWERRGQLHKLAISNRANLNQSLGRRRGGRGRRWESK